MTYEEERKLKDQNIYLTNALRSLLKATIGPTDSAELLHAINLAKGTLDLTTEDAMRVLVSKTCDGNRIQVKEHDLGSFFVSVETEPFASLTKNDVAEACGGYSFYPWHEMDMDRETFLRELHAEHRRADESQRRSSAINDAQVDFATHLDAME